MEKEKEYNKREKKELKLIRGKRRYFFNQNFHFRVFLRICSYIVLYIIFYYIILYKILKQSKNIKRNIKRVISRSNITDEKCRKLVISWKKM